jgi:hypothetical protein
MHDGIASDRPPVSRGQMKHDRKIGSRFAYDSVLPEDASKLKRAGIRRCRFELRAQAQVFATIDGDVMANDCMLCYQTQWARARGRLGLSRLRKP